MPAPIDVVSELTPDQLRALADTVADRAHARRIRAIAAVLDGKSRIQAAGIGGMERQTLRDWVHRFNRYGPEGLKNLRSPGRPPKLSSAQLADLAAIVAAGPDPAVHGVARWRLCDLVALIRQRYGVAHDEVSVGRLMKKLGYAYTGVEWRVAKPSDGAPDPGTRSDPVALPPAAAIARPPGPFEAAPWFSCIARPMFPQVSLAARELRMPSTASVSRVRPATVAAGRLDMSRFPGAHRADLVAALAYLYASPTLRAVMRRIAASGNVIHLQYHPAHTRMLHHNPANLRIVWNPCLGLRDVTGWLSPALLLAHELAHAQFTADERCAMRACERPQGFHNEAYGVEEALVIATVEQPVARELNAARHSCGLPQLETALRSQHQLGRLLEVPGPLSPAPC